MCRVPPISTKKWEEKKALFDERTGRIWPNAEVSWRAKSAREFVVKQFWTSVVGDKFDLFGQFKTDKGRVLRCHCDDGQKEVWKMEMNTRIGWVQDLQHACGTFTKAVVCNGQRHV